MYDVLSSLFEEFHAAVQRETRTLSTEELNDFLLSCMNDFPYSISTVINQHITDKAIFRMTGLLPITKDNFHSFQYDVRNFSIALLSDLKEHYNKIFSTIKADEWNLFRDGLVLYLSIDFLTQSKDTIQLIHQMKNNQCKIDLANVLLQRLEELQKPVLALNWTDLFSIVDPSILTLKQLQLTRSIEIYVTSLVEFVRINNYQVNTSEKLKRHFNELIFDERLQGK